MLLKYEHKLLFDSPCIQYFFEKITQFFNYGFNSLSDFYVTSQMT